MYKNKTQRERVIDLIMKTSVNVTTTIALLTHFDQQATEMGTYFSRRFK